MKSVDLNLDGVDSSSEGINALRDELIKERNNSLIANNFELAVKLTHVIALLGLLAHYESNFEQGG